MPFTSETQQILDHYTAKFDEIYVQPFIFFVLVAILLVIFAVRFFILYRIEKSKVKRKYDFKNAVVYIISHTLIELLLAFLISYVIIKLTNANPESYIINFVAAPALGSLVAIYLDNKVFIPIETATGLGARLLKSSSKKDTKKDDTNGIVININNGQQVETSPKPIQGAPSMDKIGEATVKYLDSELADSEEFNSEIINAINDIKTENAQQNEIISKNTKKLDTTIENLNALREAEMINKKIELKKLIYECLNQGFATPEQNEKISLFFDSYKALGGNHEIDSLYYNHYLGLPIHDYVNTINMGQMIDVVDTSIESNSRMSDRGNVNTRITKKRIYAYGEFDGEISHNKIPSGLT